jgi:DNA-binding protein HU-beta
MSKAELIDAIAADTGATKAETTKIFNSFIYNLTKSVNDGKRVVIPGIFTIEKKERKARKGRNPATGKEISIPAKNVVKIKAGKTLQDAAN